MATRKRTRGDDSDSESDAAIAASDMETPNLKKHSHPPKYSRVTRVSPAGSDGESDKEVPERVIAPKKRGCPHKVVSAADAKTTGDADFSIPVYVEIAVPPKLKPGKTYKGNKMEKQEPRMEGPFSLTRNMSWGAFLVAISNAVDEDIENLSIGNMKWGIQRKGRYPLSDRVGYIAMHKQIATQKEPSSLIIMVYLPMPKVSGRKQGQVDEHDMPVEQDNSHWGQKVEYIITQSFIDSIVLTDYGICNSCRLMNSLLQS